MPPPTVLSPEVPFPFDVGQAPLDPVRKERALTAVRNDRALIAEDEKSSRFSLASPSTWLDTKAEEARYAARDAFSRAVDRYEGLLRDPGTSPEALRAAGMDKLRALNAYNEARGVTDRAAASANYLTPLTELAEKGQDALHDVNRGVRTAMADALTSAGVPSALVGAATLPSHVFDSVVDFDAGVAKGAVQLADGLAGIVAHPDPVKAVQSVGALVDRVAQATPQGRTLELLFEAAYGKYKTPQELLAAYQERTDPLSVAKAQVELAADVGRGMFAESIRLAREGKYEEAAGTALGQNVDMFFGAGILGKGGSSASGWKRPRRRARFGEVSRRQAVRPPRWARRRGRSLAVWRPKAAPLRKRRRTQKRPRHRRPAAPKGPEPARALIESSAKSTRVTSGDSPSTTSASSPTRRGDQSAFSRSAEEAVSEATGTPRNVSPHGPGRIPGSGPGGARYPETLRFRGRDGSIRTRGTVIEIKASAAGQTFGDLPARGRQQIVDAVDYAQLLREKASLVKDPNVRELLSNARVEIFSDLPKPTRGKFARLIERGLVEWKPIPRRR